MAYIHGLGQGIWYVLKLYSILSCLLTAVTGDVVHLKLMGYSFLVLNSQKAALELLDKRSVNVISRGGVSDGLEQLSSLLGARRHVAFERVWTTVILEHQRRPIIQERRIIT
jgi:hypothetical protein